MENVYIKGYVGRGNINVGLILSKIKILYNNLYLCFATSNL